MWKIVGGVFYQWCFWILCSSIVMDVVQGQVAEHFAVGPLPSGVVLPLSHFDGFNLGIGKCLKEVPTSSLFPNAKVIPPGNGSNPYLSVIEDCCDGYKHYKYDRQYCVPKCSYKCRNGFCVAPNVCVCFTDHTRSLDDECVRTCPMGCLNGQCHMNGTCTCNAGYTLEPNKKFCVPVCSHGCGLNANCTAPEQCSCLKGFWLNPGQICEPICAPNCGHGKCVGPNMCECDRGYTLKDKSCQANCTRGCLGGRCVENDRCECDTGYRLINDGTKCEPICSKGCMNGNCTGPEHCTCFPGYELKRGVCIPSCPKGCIKGECVKPDTCVCGSGYTINSKGNKCTPVCTSGCINGKCVAPNKCDCNWGYYERNGYCVKFGESNNQPIVPQFHPTIHVQPSYITTTPSQPIYHPAVVVHPSQNNSRPSNYSAPPHCSRSCLNGVCIGQNQCKCNQGYEFELGSWYKCVPYCQGGCPNGQCSSPNFCTCNFGFVKNNGFCVYKYA